MHANRAVSRIGRVFVVLMALEAALLPKEPAQQLFGGWVASNYAVVKVNISNRCMDFR